VATIDDVARAAGVSISTVSYALSGKRSITASTRARVLDVAKQLAYAPNASARTLAGNRSHILAVTEPLHADTDQSAHMTFALEVTKAARARDYDTLLLVHDDAVVGMERTASTALADGIIVLDVDAQDERVALARSLSCPTVFIGIPDDTAGLLCVDLDFEEAARMAVDRLALAGHKSIGLISHERRTLERGSNFPLRFLRGFTKRADQLGIEHAVVYPTASRADEPIAQLLKRLPEMTGLVLNTSYDVASSVTGALARNFRPQFPDVSVIAAGVTFSTTRFPVPFDTIPIDAQTSCSTAVDLLVAAVDVGTFEPRTVLIAPEYLDLGTVHQRTATAPTQVS
jgi:DNA-binding LacI/PurR family transcriptional regulator